VVAALRRADQLAELVVEPLGAEIALLLRHPFLQAEMRFDHKVRHLPLPGTWSPLRRDLTVFL